MKKESGAILILSAFLIPVIIMMLVLAVDVGMFFLYRNNLQEVADATTLAAVDDLNSFRFQQNFIDRFNDCALLADPDLVDLYDNRGFSTADLENLCEELDGNDNIDTRAEYFSERITDQQALRTSYKNIKPTILALLSMQNIRGLNNEGRNALAAQGVRFEHALFGGDACNNNLSRQLDYDQHRSECARVGNLELRVTRGVRCYSNPRQRRPLNEGDSPRVWVRDRYFCPFELPDAGNAFDPNFTRSWEWANAVMVDMRLEDVASFFTRAAFGLHTQDIAVRSVGFLPQPQGGGNTPLCALPLCSEVFRDEGDDSAEPDFNPEDFNCQVIGQWAI